MWLKLHSFWHFHMTLECCSILSWPLRFQYSTNPSKFLRTQCLRWWEIILHAPCSVLSVQSCLCTLLDEIQWLLYFLHIISVYCHQWVHCVDCIIDVLTLGHNCSLIWLFPSLLFGCFVLLVALLPCIVCVCSLNGISWTMDRGGRGWVFIFKCCCSFRRKIRTCSLTIGCNDDAFIGC